MREQATKKERLAGGQSSSEEGQQQQRAAELANSGKETVGRGQMGAIERKSGEKRKKKIN